MQQHNTADDQGGLAVVGERLQAECPRSTTGRRPNLAGLDRGCCRACPESRPPTEVVEFEHCLAKLAVLGRRLPGRQTGTADEIVHHVRPAARLQQRHPAAWIRAGRPDLIPTCRPCVTRALALPKGVSPYTEPL